MVGRDQEIGLGDAKEGAQMPPQNQQAAGCLWDVIALQADEQ